MMSTGRELIQYGMDCLGQDKRLEAEMLLASVLSCNRAHLLAISRDEVSPEAEALYRAQVGRRAADEPLQYILGTTSFMGMDLVVTPDVLIPRFDTEILVEQAIELLRGIAEPKRVLDVCTGSGAIAVSLAKYVPGAEVWASDLSPKAVDIARENARKQGVAVQFRCGDLLEPFVGASFEQYFGLIASNPPYITTAELKELPNEVRREPTMALWGGDDGLIFYRKLAEESQHYLAFEGWLVMEIGFAQGLLVQEIMMAAGFDQVRLIKDWQGHDRVVLGQLNKRY